jgi:acyl-CoA reductase-like NAD-dependent aldehyde dehydrogenase
VLEVRNPATGEVIGRVPELGPDAVAELVARARAAQPAWEALGFEGRARVLRRAQRWCAENAERVAATIVAETGKAHEDALFVELGYTATALGFWAKRARRYLADERVRSWVPFVQGKRLVLRHAPLGVVGVIGPWNYPLLNNVGDALPALMAGNAVVLKPSEHTPLTSLLVADALRACGLPEDVLAIATGRGPTGEALVDAVDMVMLTGSTDTGRKVAERAARRLIPVSLELGGKDPLIVLADADLERAANLAVYGAMQNAGQACIAVERVYVEAPVHDAFVARVHEKVRALRQGDPAGGAGTVDVGAVTCPPQADLVEAHVRDATARGARVLVGGERRDGGGTFYAPTVLVDVDHSMRAMTEETFGPTPPTA